MTPHNGPCPNLDAGLVSTDQFFLPASHLNGVQCQETDLQRCTQAQGTVLAIRIPLYRVEEVPYCVFLGQQLY